MSRIEIRAEVQRNSVADEVAALVATVRPILAGLLYALKAEVVEAVGTYDDLPLKMLARLYRPGDGDCGLCYEYAVHDAVRNGDAAVRNRVWDALKRCKVPG